MIEADEAASAPALRVAEPSDAPRLLRIIQAAFRARPALDPPADALGDTVDEIVERLVDQVAVIAGERGFERGCLFLSLDPSADPPTGMLHRVSVLPQERLNGVAGAMVRAAGQLAADAGMRRLQLIARKELPGVVKWWAQHGFELAAELDQYRWLLAAPLPARVVVPDAAAMHQLGARLAELLRPGDLLVASGELGAGKTTLTQGLGRGLQVSGPITSPTFVLSRVHPAPAGRPQLVHVDAYRLGSAAELADLDLDESVAESVTVVEWGAGLAEELAEDRLEILIERSGDVDDETRVVTLTGVGQRWREIDLWQLADQMEES